MTQRSALVRVGAVVAPAAAAAVLGLLRDVLVNTSAALVLVLVVATVSVVGDRTAGVLAALSAAASFDFFLTEPYLRFTIAGAADVETTVLLVGTGVVITEIVRWGRRHQAGSSRRQGYLAGVAHAARMASDPLEADQLVETVSRMITDVLDLDGCRFDPTLDERSGRPRIDSDGNVVHNGHVLDVERSGLPTMDAIELPAGHGRFLLVASSRVRRPDRERRLVAVTLAEQVGVIRRSGNPSPPR